MRQYPATTIATTMESCASTSARGSTYMRGFGAATPCTGRQTGLGAALESTVARIPFKLTVRGAFKGT